MIWMFLLAATTMTVATKGLLSPNPAEEDYYLAVGSVIVLGILFFS